MANKCEDIVNLQRAEAYCVAMRTAYFKQTVITASRTIGEVPMSIRGVHLVEIPMRLRIPFPWESHGHSNSCMSPYWHGDGNGNNPVGMGMTYFVRGKTSQLH